MVGRGPILVGIPASGPAAHSAAALAAFDPADLEHGLAGSFELLGNRGYFLRCDNHRHADAAVERASHFLWGNTAALLQKAEDRRQGPSANIYDCMAAIR